MNLRSRIVRIEEQLPPRTRRSIPTDMMAFLETSVANDITADDIDRTNSDHMSWLTLLVAHLSAGD